MMNLTGKRAAEMLQALGGSHKEVIVINNDNNLRMDIQIVYSVGDNLVVEVCKAKENSSIPSAIITADAEFGDFESPTEQDYLNWGLP